MEQRNKSAYFVKIIIVLILISIILQLKKNSYLHILLYDDVITSVICEVNHNHKHDVYSHTGNRQKIQVSNTTAILTCKHTLTYHLIYLS